MFCLLALTNAAARSTTYIIEPIILSRIQASVMLHPDKSSCLLNKKKMYS